MAVVDKIDDWRMQYDSIDELWNQARIRNFQTDVTFKIGKGKKAPVYTAHKNVLTFNSPVFERMFYGPVAENSTIVIKDVETEVFEAFLSYLYGDKSEKDMRSWSIPFAAKVYLVANKYSVHRLKSILEDNDIHMVMEDVEFWEIVLNEKLFNIPIFTVHCLDYFSKHTSNVFDSRLLVKVSANVLETILFSTDLEHVSEYRILETAVAWGIHNVKPRENLKDEMHRFLRNIKFSKLTLDEFCTFLDTRRDLLDSKDSLAILMYLVDPTVHCLPQWCCETTDLSESVSNSEENGPLEG